MTVCILGNNLTALTLAKTLVNHKINVHLFFNKKDYKIDESRTIGIANNNINFFNNYIINIEKIIWKLKRIEIFSDNLKKERLINFKTNKDYLFSIVKNNKLYQLLEKDLSKNKFFKSKFSNEKKISFLINMNL
jgi:2-octaprenyl-6-methoxyphenol hydroxylase